LTIRVKLIGTFFYPSYQQTSKFFFFPQAYPLSKLNKKIKDFFNKLIDSLNRTEYETIFDFIIEEIVDESKALSHHGYKIIAQMLTKKYPSLGLKNLSKVMKKS
jgi:hypothetical protein